MNAKKPLAVIWDIDQVLCKSWRPEFKKQFEMGDFTEFEEGIPSYGTYEWAITLLQLLRKASVATVFVTARNEKYKYPTMAWLEEKIGLKPDDYTIYMRPEDNTEADRNLKERAVKELTADYNILFAIDDKVEVAKLWADYGLASLHVVSSDIEYLSQLKEKTEE